MCVCLCVCLVFTLSQYPAVSLCLCVDVSMSLIRLSSMSVPLSERVPCVPPFLCLYLSMYALCIRASALLCFARYLCVSVCISRYRGISLSAYISASVLSSRYDSQEDGLRFSLSRSPWSQFLSLTYKHSYTRCRALL